MTELCFSSIESWTLVSLLLTEATCERDQAALIHTERMMQYRETLPPDCPTPSALSITEQTVRYRLLEGITPAQKDFDTFAKQN